MIADTWLTKASSRLLLSQEAGTNASGICRSSFLIGIFLSLIPFILALYASLLTRLLC